VPIERSNAGGLAEPPGYTHLASVTSSRLIFLAGQVPLDEHGDLVGRGDAAEQGRQCLRNLAACLAEAGAGLEDVVRTTVYVVADHYGKLGDVWRALIESEFGAALRTPATLLGVSHLGYDGQLVEVECTAAVPLDDEAAIGS
jgi:enamine deaminase RidA (YjgF/YER057c/UK114 family)